MNELRLLTDLLVVLGLAVATVVLFHALRLPPVVGFLVAGVLSGPHGLALATSVHEIEVLAEVGVILLLFTIGIEFSLDRLVRLWRTVLVGGGLQVGLTLGIAALAARAFGAPWKLGLFIGMGTALSSTAVVARLIAERGEVDTPHGRASIAVLTLVVSRPIRSCGPSPYAATGGSRTNSSGDSMLCFEKTTIGFAKAMQMKTSPSCAT